jgi:hypothetical protein
MRDDDSPYVPKLPSLVPPAAPSGIESEQARFHRARGIRDPISSIAHRVGEWSSRKSLESTARRFAALQGAAENFSGAVGAMAEARETVMRFKVQGELTQLRHDFAVQRAISTLHTEWNRDAEALHEAQRKAINARHGVDAALVFKDAKFRLGQARAEARIAETAELIEPVEEPAASDAVGEFRRLRDELRADGIDPDAAEERRVPIRRTRVAVK